MNDCVERSHLTKFDAFRVNRDQVIDLETWFKIHTNVSNVETASPKPFYVCMDFDPCFKVYNLVSLHPKSIKLGQMTWSNDMCWCQFIDWLYFESRPSSL